METYRTCDFPGGCCSRVTVLNKSSFHVYTNFWHTNCIMLKIQLHGCHWMKVIAVHALISFSKKIGFGHSITCNILKKNALI